MNTPLDQTMEQASVALAKMDYLTCEALCLDALADARRRGDWTYYGAILLPLQEARRQRRMIAAEGVVRLGTASLEKFFADEWLANLPAGCIVLTVPHSADDARALDARARHQRKHVEVLFAEERGAKWLIRSFASPPVSCEVIAPTTAHTQRWIKAGEQPAAVDWFLDACEALGDAAMQAAGPISADAAGLAKLEACLGVVTDHEIIHQRLGALARGLARGPQ
jgi:hypothetical protein